MYTVEQLIEEFVAPDPALRAVRVHKSRRDFVFAQCLAETVDLRIDDVAMQSFSLEHENPASVLAALRSLGLDPHANTNYPRGIVQALGIGHGKPGEVTPLRTLQELLRTLRARGRAPAIIATGGDGAVALTFAEVFEASRRFAQDIAARGLKPGSVIGLMAPNSPAWIEAFFGIVTAGCVAMPVDVQISDEDLLRMLAMGECRLVIAGSAQIERLGQLAPSCGALDIEPAAAAAPSDMASPPPSAPDDTAILVFTSGTTGVPKAVPLSHANVMSNVEAMADGAIIGPRDRALVPLPFHHAYPLTVGILSVLASGATIILPAGMSGPQLVAAMREGKATALLGVPRLYDALLTNIRAEVARQPWPVARLFPVLLAASSLLYRHFHISIGRWLFGKLRARIGPTLRLLVSGGAALSPDVEMALNALGWRVLTGYGLTETSPILAFNRPGRARFGAAGQALPGVRLRIAHPDAMGVGEIEACGSSVFAGYIQAGAATEAAFTPDGWFRTGDLGRLDEDGYLFIAARATETIILQSGKKVYPETVEKAYVGIAIIREIAVLRSDGGLAALVVPNDDAVREAGALRLRGLVRDALNLQARTLEPYLRLSGFAVMHAPLPRTQLGKIRRHLLPALYERARQQQVAGPGAAPAAADEALLANQAAARLWPWIRARYPSQPVDLDTSPQLDLGIDSLGWIDLTLALQQDFGIVLAEPQIARIVTIRDLLREAAAAKPAPDRPARNIWLEPYGACIRAVRIAGEVLLRVVARVVFKLSAHGGETLPASPFLICPNHVSYLDAFALAASLPHRKLQDTYWAGWTGLLFSSWLRRLFSRAAQVIPIDPDRAVAAGIALGAAVLSSGRTLVWFPEGGLSPDGSLQPFQPGIGAVLERCPVPVVPVYISGTEAALAPGRRFPRACRVTIRFGAPIDPTALPSGGAGRDHQQAIAMAIQAAVAAVKPKQQP